MMSRWVTEAGTWSASVTPEQLAAELGILEPAGVPAVYTYSPEEMAEIQAADELAAWHNKRQAIYYVALPLAAVALYFALRR